MPVRRLVIVLALLATQLITLGFGTSAAAAPTVSTSHPYSDPVWFPVHDEVYVDCVLTNPGCAGAHDGWTIDVVLETLGVTAPSRPGVYAMGAGVLHVGYAHGAKCGTSHPDFGTWVWIDHGAGVISRYGHLASISVPDGTLVAAGQRIGTMGTTGKGGNCSVPYVDFQVRHGGVKGRRVEIKTLNVCSGATTVQWPSALMATDHWRQHPVFAEPSKPTRYAVWNDVPQRSVDFPATGSACLPSGAPRTPSGPASLSVRRSSSGRLTATWSAPAASPATTSVRLQLSLYHPSVHRWDVPEHIVLTSVSPTTRSHTFTGLLPGRRYAVRVWFHNSAGNSRASAWVRCTA